MNPKTIRYYEELGLLPPAARSESGYRQYDEVDLQRLQFVQNAKSLGLSLGEVHEILDVSAQGMRPCSHVAHLLDEKLAILDRRI